MTIIKSFTSLEQSKKLAEILPLESADYHYITQREKSYFYPYSLSSDAIKDYDEEIKYIPCWSLTALLSVLNFPSLTQNKENEWEVCVFDHDNDDYIEKTASNPVDACYEMIKSLHELNLL